MHEVKGQGPDHENACHLRRGKRQTAANGVAAKIQTETIKKLGAMSGMGQTEKWRRLRQESVRPHTTDIERVRAEIMIYAQIR